jgi:hypothetical protein
MTDIFAATPKTDRHSSLQRPSIPVLRIRGSLVAISALLGDAFSMAYVAPYTSRGRSPQADLNDRLDGRDPTW